MQPTVLRLTYESLTGPRDIEIAPIKQMGRVRWHVLGNDRSVDLAGSFFDTQEQARTAVADVLRRRYGEQVTLDWRSA